MPYDQARKTARTVLLILLAGLVIFLAVMIPVLIVNGKDVIEDCLFSIGSGWQWQSCLAAIGGETVSWFLFKWVTLALVVGVVATVLVMIALGIGARKKSTGAGGGGSGRVYDEQGNRIGSRRSARREEPDIDLGYDPDEDLD